MLPILRPPFANLIRNYRSHPAILATSSSLFYFDTLLPQQERLSSLIATWSAWSHREGRIWPLMFHNHGSPDAVESVTAGDGTGAGSLTNLGEAQIALKCVQDLLTHAQQYQHDIFQQSDIIIMAPFRAQVNLLRKLFREHDLHDVRIGPLEAFQGLESRVVVLCTTRTRLGGPSAAVDKYVREDRRRNLGIVDAPKLFNVSVTRAKEALIVIGNTETLTATKDVCWSNFLAFCGRNGLMVGDKAQDTFVTGVDVKISTLETALKYADKQQRRSNTLHGDHIIYGYGNSHDLDNQMNHLHVSEEDEALIRVEEDEDNVIHESGEEGEESEVDIEDPELVKVVDAILGEND